MSRPEIRIKRVYDAPEAADGLRVLVDRVWPRGKSKDVLRIDHQVRILHQRMDHKGQVASRRLSLTLDRR